MVTIGTLSWKVQVEEAKEAYNEAKEIEDKVEGAKESMEAADETTEGLSDKLGGLEEAQEVAGKGFDKMNAKAGFFGSALAFVKGSIMAVVGAIVSLKGLLIGGGLIAAVVAIATAWKNNIGNIKGRIEGFKQFLSEQFAAAKATVLKIWNNLTSGFKEGGGDIEDLKVIFTGMLKGLQQGLQAFWQMFGPIWSQFMGLVVAAAKPIGQVIGGIINWIAKMEEQFGVITKIVGWITALVAVFATAWAIVQVVTAIVSAIIGFVSAMGSVMSAAATVISVIGTLISVLSTIIGVIAGVVAALNPVTLAILAIVGVIVTLYAAWKTNFLGIRDIVDDVVASISKRIDDAVAAIRNAIDNILSVWDSFTSTSLGKNLIKAIVGGITGNSGMLVEAVSGVVSEVRSYLPFSPAEVGPLSDIDKSGEGLVKTVATGIEDETPKLAKSAEGAAQSVKKGLKSDGVQTGKMARRGAGSSSGGGTEMKKIEVNVGGVEVGDQTLDLSKMSRQDLRRLAQEIAGELGDDVRSVVS